MKLLFQKILKNYRFVVFFIILLIYCEFRLNKTNNQNKINIEQEIDFSKKENLFFQLSHKFNNLLRFGDQYKNFVNSMISRESQNDSIKLGKQEIETFKDLNK